MNLWTAFTWPEHHASAAWWIAALLSAPWWMGRCWKLLKLLPIWGGKFARNELSVRIRVLERLHGDTNQLILYMLREFFSVALDVSLLILFVAFLLHSTAMPLRKMAYFFSFYLGTSLVGNVIRLRMLVNDLMDYTATVTRLKAKQSA